MVRDMRGMRGKVLWVSLDAPREHVQLAAMIVFAA